MSPNASLKPVTVPDIGGLADIPVIEILVSVGDTIATEDPLVTLESDKATMDLPSPAAGTVKAIHVKVGDKVSEGSALIDLESDDASSAESDQSPASEQAPDPTSDDAKTSKSAAASGEHPEPTPETEWEAAPAAGATDGKAGEAAGGAEPEVGNAAGQTNGRDVYASPSVRRLARELGIDLHGISGTGRNGRVTAEDVRGAQTRGGIASNNVVGLNIAPWPTVDFEKFGPVERLQRSRIQRIAAPNLARNWVMIPHVTHNDEADITELEVWRKRLNDEYAKDDVKFTMVSFLIAATVATLKEFPNFNSSLDGEDLILRKYFNIGFAADTPNGLVVPVIKNADTKGLLQIARELAELSGKARAGKLGPVEMSGGTFTISSLGGIGGTSFTPIINAPEVAILGVTRSAVKPVWDEAGGVFAPRLMLPLSLSYDHRVIDGAAAARFVSHLIGVLSDLRRALL